MKHTLRILTTLLLAPLATLHAAETIKPTIMHLLGFDHERLTYRFQGRDYRLTDVHGHVVKEIIA